MRRVVAALVLVLAAATAAAGTLSVSLTLSERAGVARVAEPVLSGVPLPRAAQIFDPAGLSLVDEVTGEVIDADLVVTARWGGPPDDRTLPVKWLLLAFRCSLEAGGERRVLLTDYRPGTPAMAITLTVGPEIWTVDTAAAVFEVATSGSDLLHRVSVGGAELVAPAATNGAYLVDGGTIAYAAQAVGGSRLTVYRQGAQGQTLTLQVKGAHRTFGPGDPVLASDDDLDFNTFLTFAAGSAVVRVHHTIQNNRDWVPLENNADFRNIGSAHAVAFDEAGLGLAIATGAAPVWQLATAPDGGPLAGSLDDDVVLYQDSAGGDSWALWRDLRATGSAPVAAPVFGPSSYVSFRGFTVTDGGVVVADGDRFAGWLDLAGSTGGVTVALRDLWQGFPKALRATADGRLEIALFPTEFRARHSLRVGEQKSHELLLAFHGPGAGNPAGVGAAASAPLMAVAPPAWYAELSRAVAAVSTTAPPEYRFTTVPPPAGDPTQLPVSPAQWDAAMVRHLEGPGVTGYSFDGLDEAVAASSMYGWMDYGDVPIDFEGQWQEFPVTLGCGGRARSTTGQYGWKYDGDYGLLVQYLRSGDPRFLGYGLAAVRHTADIDLLHHGVQSERGVASFLDGGGFGHSEHDTDGDLNPHRNGTDPIYDATLQACSGGAYWNGTPNLDVTFGAKGLALGYFLTGEPPLAQALGDLAAWLPLMADQWLDGGNPRAVTNLLESLTAASWLSGDPGYRAIADSAIASSPLLANPLGASWFDSRLGAAFGEWVAWLREADDGSHDDTLAVVDGGHQSLAGYSGDAFRADAYGWGARLLPRGAAELLAKADEAFASAVLWPAFPGNLYGLQVVWQIKEWVNLLRAGDAYQLAVYDRRGGPMFTPTAPPVTPGGGAAIQNQAPSAVIAGGPTVMGDTDSLLDFDGSGSSDPETGASELHYLWDFGDGARTTGRQVTHRFEEAGERTVRLWVGDGEAAALAVQTATISFVNHPPTAVAGADRLAPAGVALELDGRASSDPDGQPLSLSWDLGDGSTATGPVVSHIWPGAGVWTVVLTASDGELASTDSLTVEAREAAATVATLLLQDGVDSYAGTRDVRLWSRLPAGNYGAADELFVGNMGPGDGGVADPELHALLRFDLAAVPAGARIDSAVLRLVASQGGAEPLRVHRVERGWLEGSGTWGNTGDGASWAFADGANSWTVPGGDLGPPLVSFTSPASAGDGVEVEVTAIVQQWATGAANDGLGLTMDPGTYWQYAYLAARESSAVSSRPCLTITFAPLTADSVLFADGFESGDVSRWSIAIPEIHSRAPAAVRDEITLRGGG